MTTTKVKASTAEHKAAPGTLLSARITFAGNGPGVNVDYEYAPENKEKGEMCYPGWEPKQPSIYATIDDATMAIKAERSSNDGSKKKK